MDARRPNPRLTAIVIAMAVLIAAPLAVMASDRFTDVPDSSVFHDDIAWLADADVTRGCNPPANTRFCPKDFVTREQMAAFMNRLANNEVVNAATAVTAESAANATTADSINGITIERFFHQAPPNTTRQEIDTYGPVTLYATCNAAGEPLLEASWDVRVDHLSLNGGGISPSQIGTLSVDPGAIAPIGSGQFGSVGLAEAVSYDSHFHTSIEYFLRDAPTLGVDQCMYSGFVTLG